MVRLWLLLSGIMLFTAGCMTNSFRDLDRRFFVLAIGVDKSNDDNKKYHVTLKLDIPSAKMEPGNAKSQLISTDAESIPEAIRLLKSHVDKELDFGHAKMILLGEALAKEDITQTVDFFVRRRDIQGLAFMAVGSPDASKILKIEPKSERLPANALFLSFDGNGTESSFIVTEYLFDFHRRMTEKGLDPYLPIIEPVKDNFVIERVGVFNKTKMIAELSPDETRIFNELARNFRKFDLTTRTEDVEYTLIVEKFNRRFSFRSKDENKLLVKITIQGIAEQSKKPILKNEWTKYEHASEKAAQGSYVNLLQKLQKFKVDPIGLGLIYTAGHYNEKKDWETWQKIYPDLTFDVQVHVKLEGTGVIK